MHTARHLVRGLGRLMPLFVLAMMLAVSGVAQAEYLYRHKIGADKLRLANTPPPEDSPGEPLPGDPPPVWATEPDLGMISEGASLSISLQATGASAYALASGTLPAGVVLSPAGLLSGTAPTVNVSTTYDFTVRATNAAGDADRAFTLQVADVPSGMQEWSSASTVTFTVPTGVTLIRGKVWGAGGGSGTSGQIGATVCRGGNGGGGGYVSGLIAVTPGETLTIHVAGGGAFQASNYFGGGGGGASAVGNASGSALLVAGGGGGGGSRGSCSDGGAGGGGGVAGSQGNDQGVSSVGGAGTTTAGGSKGNSVNSPSSPKTDGSVGSATRGGNGGYQTSQTAKANGGTGYRPGGSGGAGIGGGGGGGGYRGGGGGGAGNGLIAGSGGGGGSSHAIGASDVVIENGSDRMPGGTGDGDYQGPAGSGGSGSAGTAGRVVLSWGPNI